MHVRRFLSATALVGSLFVVADGGVVRVRPAGAQTARGDSNESSIGAGAATPGASGGGPGGSPASMGSGNGGGRRRPSSWSSPCKWTKVPPEAAVASMLAGSIDRSANQAAIPSDWMVRTVYLKDCPGRGYQFVFVPLRGPGSGPGDLAPPTAGDLAQEAAEDTPLPVPTVGMAPASPIPQLVGLTSFLWIDPAQWAPQSASASAGGVTSTVTATPMRVVWEMGNGDSVSCDGPGARYEPALSDELQPSSCRYTYERGSAGAPGDSFTVTTTVEWDVEWVAVGAPGGGPLGTARRSSTTAVQVGEIQALNVPVR